VRVFVSIPCLSMGCLVAVWSRGVQPGGGWWCELGIMVAVGGYDSWNCQQKVRATTGESSSE